MNRLLNTLKSSCLEIADAAGLMISLSLFCVLIAFICVSNDMGSGRANEQARKGGYLFGTKKTFRGSVTEVHRLTARTYIPAPRNLNFQEMV
jgi:hypothetical protein